MQGESGATRAWIRVAVPLLVLVLAALAARAILDSRPEPEVRPPAAESVPRVEATRLVATGYRPMVRGRGTVRPTRRNALVSEIAGTVTSLSDDFVVGGAFREGDVLVRIDERDSAIALTRARAELARAEAQFEEQAALAEQAVLEWRQLGRSGEPSSLTLREPQLDAARAERDAAAAELERAELDLERTRILAPYEGLVLERAVDVGQFVARGTLLGRVHASDALEVSVPLGARQLARLALPGSPTADGRSGGEGAERSPDDAGTGPIEREVGGASAEVVADGGGRERRWPGSVVRVERVDPLTQQLDVVVRIDDPLAATAAPPRVGQQVEVIIEGRTLEDVFVVPRAALREGDEVVLVDAEDRLRRRAVDVVWTDVDVVAVATGLSAGERLVLTPLSSVADGAPVQVVLDGVEGAGTDGAGDGTRGERAGEAGVSATPERADPDGGT